MRRFLLFQAIAAKTMISNIHQWLSQYQLPMTISQAQEFVSLVHSSSQYLGLYQHYFPNDWYRAMQHNGKRSLIPLPDNAYTSLELQFLRLVSKHFFPIPDYVLDDPCGENRCYSVPIEPYGLGGIFEDGGDAILDMDLGWQLLLYLTGELGQGFFDGIDLEDASEIFQLEIVAGRVSRTMLCEQCRKQTGPLAHLGLALAMLDHDTGIAWLDATYDMPIEDASWEREVVDELVRQYAECEQIWLKCQQFVSWLEEDILKNFTEVVNLWNQCVMA